MANTSVVKSSMEKMKLVLATPSVQEQFKNAMGRHSDAFVASIIDLYGSDKALQECNPNAVVAECLKGAVLKLPINKQLGFAYVIAYKKVPTFQMGYKGYIQLALRTGQYRCMNAGAVPQGVKVTTDLLSGAVSFNVDNAKATGDPQGYFAHMETVSGFSKTWYMTKEQVVAHAKRYSKSYDNPKSAWKTNFEGMAIKTPLRLLLSHYGMLSTEMERALQDDDEAQMDSDIAQNANKTPIDIDPDTGARSDEKDPPKPPKKAETPAEEAKPPAKAADAEPEESALGKEEIHIVKIGKLGEKSGRSFFSFMGKWYSVWDEELGLTLKDLEGDTVKLAVKSWSGGWTILGIEPEDK